MAQIAGKYRVIKKLGEGFGGQVYLAETDGQKVALKQMVLEPGELSPEETLENFKREFSVLTKLSHPNIVRILDFGFDLKEQLYYFTTEYLEGPNIFEATRAIPPQQTEELFVQIFRALSYLHSQRVYHLDIKPQNIMVAKSEDGPPVAKLIDFGLSEFRSKGNVVGTPSYLPPEALLGESRDGRSDLYSLGVTWYECLAGKNPFHAESTQKILNLHRIWAPPPLSSTVPNIASDWDPILTKLLRKNPADRYHHADQVIRDLNWMSGRHYPLETEATALAYLPGEGRLIGRKKEWSEFLSLFERVFLNRSTKRMICLITGPAGSGKSRFLKEIKYHSQLHTIPVIDAKTTKLTEIKGDSLLLADESNPEILEMARKSAWQLSPYSLMVILAGDNLKKETETDEEIVLKNFDRSAVAQYVASVLGAENPPEALVEQLTARTEGNPLFLTELLHSLIQSQQIFDQQGRWSPDILKMIGIDFSQLQVPQTLSEYCAQKYQKLPDGSQRILRLVALAHSPLNRSHLLKLNLNPADLERLQDEGLMTMDPLSGELRLLNPSFCNWILNHLDPSTLSSTHQSLGELFQNDSRLEEATAYHLGYGSNSQEERFESLTRLGELVRQKNHWLEAAEIFGQASHLTETAEKKVKALFQRAVALFHAASHTESLKAFRDIQEILKQERDKPDRWRWAEQTYREMGSIAIKMRKLDLAREALEAARVVLEEHEDNTVEEMILTNHKASLLLLEGKISEATSLLEQTHQRWRDMPPEKKREIKNNELGSLYLQSGRFEEAIAVFREQAHFYKEIATPVKEAAALYGWAEGCYHLGRYDEATPLFQACLEISRDLKNEEFMFHVFNGLGNIAYCFQKWDQAAENYEKALELARHHGDLDGSIGIAINLAIVFHHQGDHGRSFLYLKQIIETLEEKPSPSLHQLNFLTQAYLEQAQLFLESQKWSDAHEAFRDAFRMVRCHPALKRFRKFAVLGLAQCDVRLDKIEEAQSMLGELERESLSADEQSIFEKTKKTFQERVVHH